MSIYITYLNKLCLSGYYDCAVSIYCTLIVESTEKCIFIELYCSNFRPLTCFSVMIPEAV